MPRLSPSLRNRSTVAGVFTAGGGNHRIDSGSQPSVEIADLKSRRNLIGNNPFTDSVRQRALKTITGLNSQFSFLYKHEQNRAVVAALLPRLPRPERILGKVFDRSIPR